MYYQLEIHRLIIRPWKSTDLADFADFQACDYPKDAAQYAILPIHAIEQF